MKKLLIIICCLIICLSSTMVFAAGTCIYHRKQPLGEYTKYWWTVTADASGNMTETGAGCTSEPITGLFIQAEFWPDASSAWASTTDAQLRGTNINPAYNTNYDYCHGVGTDVSATITDADNIRTPVNTDSSYIRLHGVKLTPWLDEAGNGGKGIIFAIVKTK